MEYAGRTFLTLSGIYNIAGPYLADYSKSHLFNPNWTGHAKFHTGQTMSLGVYLGLLTIYFGLRRSRDQLDSLNTAGVLGAAYWITQCTAMLHPNVLAADRVPIVDRWYFPQKYPVSIGLMLVGIGYLLERARLVGLKRR